MGTLIEDNRMNDSKYTKDYLFALLIRGNESEKYDALKELCKRYKELSYGNILELIKQHRN